MATKKRQTKRPALLSHTRPRILNKQNAAAAAASPSLSSKATRNLIRSHHQLLKARERAVSTGDTSLIAKIDAQITANGGLESYQLASKTGQSRERGGDSSTVFLEWIRPILKRLKQQQQQGGQKMRLLEVGALSTRNACSQHECIDVTRIDLNSQEPGILQQDFMERPLPSADNDLFHAISLSLVLNFVPSAAQRGEMLRRCSLFLTSSSLQSVLTAETKSEFAPYLFLVLPAACVLNSRYFNSERLHDIATTLGYRKLEEKVTNKLIYQLWEFRPPPLDSNNNRQVIFRKEELNPGKTRNNFTITLNANHGLS
jgi:25S rRNA (adenine2142-N1)-methyltransferase